MSAVTTDLVPFALPPLQAEVQAQAEELAARYAERHREIRLHPFEHGELHPELWQEISELGWPGLLVPTAHGGIGGGSLSYLIVMQALAAHNLILWMPVLSAAIGHAIAEVGPTARVNDGCRESPRVRRSSRSQSQSPSVGTMCSAARRRCAATVTGS